MYIVGRFNLIEYDLEKNSMINRYPFPQPLFPNDVACDESGNIFVTDGAKAAVYKLENGKLTEWVKTDQLAGANGIIAVKGKLFIGTSSDGSIKMIDQNTKEISTLFSFGTSTVMDGLVEDGLGNFLISDNAGRLFRISPDGRSELLINAKARQISIADFGYIPEKKLLIIPTLTDNKLIMYKIEQ